MFIGDYHTHSKFSADGKSTIEENMISAEKKGLKEIAVTEHAYSNLNGIKKGDLTNIVSAVEEARKKHPKIKIFMGMEINLLDEKGNVDLTKEEQSLLDIAVLGFHRRCRFFKYKLSHYRMLYRKTSKQIEKNTDAYIKALENNKIDIIAHLNYACNVNVKRIAEYAKEHDILIELNGKRILFSEQEVKDLIDSGVKFIADSDAHRSVDVGDNSRAFNFATKYGIPFDRIVNWNDLPKFKGRGR